MEEEGQLRHIINSMDDAVCVCDLEGKILMCNNAHLAMIGYRKEEIVGVGPPYPWVDPHDVDKTLIGFKRLRKEGMLRNFPITWRKRDSLRLTVSFTVSPLLNTSGKHIGYVCTGRDITNVQYVEEIRKAREQNERLIKDIQYNAVRLRTLERTNTLVLQDADSSAFFKEIMSGVKKLVRHDLAGIYVLDSLHNCLVAHTLSKQTPFSRKLAKFPLALGKGIIGVAAMSGKMVWQNNAHLDSRSKYPPGVRPEKEHFIAVPLKGRKSIFGILVVARHRNPEFIEEEALIVKSLAEAASVALGKSRVFSELPLRRRSTRAKS
jgi:PAS domain S-box-containing protein